MTERDRGPKSDFARYAYGYSDKKPHWSFWLILGAMAAYVVFQLVTIV